MSQAQQLIRQLNAADRQDRLDAMSQLAGLIRQGNLPAPQAGLDVNNHIHTTYSFSPYSPAMAVWKAAQAGLETAGIMDHDSISGAEEFLEAARIIGLPVTIGAEIRVSFAGTSLAGRRINNPDQQTIAYVAMHGVPHNRIDQVKRFFEPIQKARDARNRQMTVRLSSLLEESGITLDYDRDVLPLSQRLDGGEVTERHLLFAAAGKMIAKLADSKALIDLLTGPLSIALNDSQRAKLLDMNNEHIQYDLLGVLKSSLVSQFYIDAAGEECPPAHAAAAFARENGIILAYAYLGDVRNSVTGDKADQAFEDNYLDDVFEIIKQTGFNAVTYMPSRNTREQLVRLRGLCEQHGMFQISGEDINSPRQVFICEKLRDPYFANLRDSAWALIGHEAAATKDIGQSLFGSGAIEQTPDLEQRIKNYAEMAKKSFGKAR